MKRSYLSAPAVNSGDMPRDYRLGRLFRPPSVPNMRAAIFNEPGSVTVGERPDASLKEPTDAVVRVVLACVCGSDLWYYRGDSPFEPGPIGHEFVGVVEDVGSEVTNVKKGDFVIAPF